MTEEGRGVAGVDRSGLEKRKRRKMTEELVVEVTTDPSERLASVINLDTSNWSHVGARAFGGLEHLARARGRPTRCPEFTSSWVILAVYLLQSVTRPVLPVQAGEAAHVSRMLSYG